MKKEMTKKKKKITLRSRAKIATEENKRRSKCIPSGVV
jgi:hypothetical protein